MDNQPNNINMYNNNRVNSQQTFVVESYSPSYFAHQQYINDKLQFNQFHSALQRNDPMTWSVILYKFIKSKQWLALLELIRVVDTDHPEISLNLGEIPHPKTNSKLFDALTWPLAKYEAFLTFLHHPRTDVLGAPGSQQPLTNLLSKYITLTPLPILIQLFNKIESQWEQQQQQQHNNNDNNDTNSMSLNTQNSPSQSQELDTGTQNEVICSNNNSNDVILNKFDITNLPKPVLNHLYSRILLTSNYQNAHYLLSKYPKLKQELNNFMNFNPAGSSLLPMAELRSLYLINTVHKIPILPPNFDSRAFAVRVLLSQEPTGSDVIKWLFHVSQMDQEIYFAQRVKFVTMYKSVLLNHFEYIYSLSIPSDTGGEKLPNLNELITLDMLIEAIEIDNILITTSRIDWCLRMNPDLFKSTVGGTQNSQHEDQIPTDFNPHVSKLITMAITHHQLELAEYLINTTHRTIPLDHKSIVSMLSELTPSPLPKNDTIYDEYTGMYISRNVINVVTDNGEIGMLKDGTIGIKPTTTPSFCSFSFVLSLLLEQYGESTSINCDDNNWMGDFNNIVEISTPSAADISNPTIQHIKKSPKPTTTFNISIPSHQIIQEYLNYDDPRRGILPPLFPPLMISTPSKYLFNMIICGANPLKNHSLHFQEFDAVVRNSHAITYYAQAHENRFDNDDDSARALFDICQGLTHLLLHDIQYDWMINDVVNCGKKSVYR